MRWDERTGEGDREAILAYHLVMAEALKQAALVGAEIAVAVPGKSPYAEARYSKEAKRLWRVLDARLNEVEYVAGDYSIADIAIWPWISRFEWQTVDFADYPNVERWYVAIAKRPAVQRGWDLLQEGRVMPMP
jgi:glutathione S-transferase